MKLFLPVVISMIGAVAAQAPAGAVDDTAWYSITTENGALIGHAFHQETRDRDGREITDSQEVDVVDEGTPDELMALRNATRMRALTSQTVRDEDAEGRTVSVRTDKKNGPDWSRIEASIFADRAEITRNTPAETRTITIALPPSVRFDNGDGLLRTWTAKAKPPLSFDNFNIDAMAVEHVTIEAQPDMPGPTGTTVALRERFDGNELVAVGRLLVDGSGRIVEASQPMPGEGLIIRAVTKEAALTSTSSYRAVPSVMRKSIVRIPPDAMHAHIRYRFKFRDGIEFHPPETAEQRVAVEGGFATFDICDDCGTGLPTDAAYLADAGKPTAWLQSDSPKLIAIAAPVAAMKILDARKMELLRQLAKPYLGRVDFTGHYSALETLSRHAADCTEAAVLLAALGRAAGIPTRVADGLVYSRESYHGVSNAWMPHSWTLAFVDGHWRSFDLALDEFDSTHIALAVGNGDERLLLEAGQRAGLLDWQSIVEVKRKPEN